MTLYLLFENSTGYALFERVEADEVAMELPAVQEAVQQLDRFGKLVKLKGFVAFSSAEEALQNINDISEGVLSETLKNFLEMNLKKPKSVKKCKFKLGVADPKIGSAIQDELMYACNHTDGVICELLRGIRMHLPNMIKDLTDSDLSRAQLGLAHSYSRAKVKFNVHKVDNMIIQAIALVDQLDKDINTFAMRVREWYGWHFPEMVKVCTDNIMYCRVAQYVKQKNKLTPEMLPGLTAITMDETIAKNVFEAAKTSMGFDISDIDVVNIEMFASKVTSLADYRVKLNNYLNAKMNAVAPNLSALIGEIVGARLISHAGSLTNLAKYPASTVQILGAEKALFRALKTKGNTPKYGLIFHSSFIGRAQQKNKGRISRYLANKCSIASRIDCFSEESTNVFGTKLRDQVEERLKFYDSGDAPRKNIDVMREAIKEAGGEAAATTKKEKKSKKRKAGDDEEEEAATKKEKKSKKSKKAKEGDDDGEKKKKKKKKSKKE